MMKQILPHGVVVHVPLPVFLVIEDVGWWQGADGSAANEPYRSGLGRRHCLADYEALVHLARRLDMRIALGMVIGEWDRSNYLKNITGATWMGGAWDNGVNQGPWLEETSRYLRDHRDCLEIGVHGLCHEFWRDGRLERSEFHDSDGNMRPPAVVRGHLEAFKVLLGQNRLDTAPRLFIPPALNHSFGNGKQSMQALLRDCGVEYVITRFSRARRFAPPRHAKITWECGVGLLERGISPVPWHETAARPAWGFNHPVLPLHWNNVLHVEPARNLEVAEAWAAHLLAGSTRPDRVLVPDVASCWNQAALFYLGRLSSHDGRLTIDLTRLPVLGRSDGSFVLKIEAPRRCSWRCRGGRILAHQMTDERAQILKLRPDSGQKAVELEPTADR